jgi:hypothetical protein
MHLARVHARVEYLKLRNYRIAWAASRGTPAPGRLTHAQEAARDELSPADASTSKVFGTEFAIEGYRLLMEVLGAAAVVRTDSPGAVLHGVIERRHRSALILTFGGGTNEVQRDIIAATALTLPVSR